MIKITNKIPSPSREAWDVIMSKMEVGDSFPVDNGKEKAVRHSAWRYFHRIDLKTQKPVSNKVFTVRRDPTDLLNFRCWRDE
ncbi:hypothetical protein [Sphingobacterium hotanense]|uniref:Uncharacterized protein n=1 Tax=Sphingobacterium hotanense TaxID=649196 RepID=A0ABT7NQ97_9SPHI|nr:hypothetical protein [Sphingobacterium hotanense]MDM1049340.1 hypothetical protein [Sphingobacterium hotanense]